MDSLPAGWQCWNEARERIVLVYRPDVFDTDAFPAPCLPTIYVTHGTRDRRPGHTNPSPDDDWHVTLYLEPEITGRRRRADDRASALEAARDLATAFADGEFDVRSWYQQPREAYLDRLDSLTGRA